MELVVREEFEVKANLERAWEFFSDPKFVVPCIPGAELTQIREDGSFDGVVKVKLGAVALNFVGTMKYEKLDKENKIMILTGEGKEKGGAGRAKAKIESVFNQENEALKITVTTTVDISGKILQYGRGMFEQIAKQHFMQFSACAKSYLESQPTSEEKKTPPEPVKLRTFPLLLKAFFAWLMVLLQKLFKGKAKNQEKIS